MRQLQDRPTDSLVRGVAQHLLHGGALVLHRAVDAQDQEHVRRVLQQGAEPLLAGPQVDQCLALARRRGARRTEDLLAVAQQDRLAHDGDAQCHREHEVHDQRRLVPRAELVQHDEPRRHPDRGDRQDAASAPRELAEPGIGVDVARPGGRAIAGDQLTDDDEPGGAERGVPGVETPCPRAAGEDESDDHRHPAVHPARGRQRNADEAQRARNADQQHGLERGPEDRVLGECTLADGVEDHGADGREHGRRIEGDRDALRSGEASGHEERPAASGEEPDQPEERPIDDGWQRRTEQQGGAIDRLERHPREHDGEHRPAERSLPCRRGGPRTCDEDRRADGADDEDQLRDEGLSAARQKPTTQAERNGRGRGKHEEASTADLPGRGQRRGEHQ